jgi:guanine nucleotide-binding protein G(i) subunit alpha
VASISEYDQGCYEEEDVNRMIESLSLFNSTMQSPLLKQTPVILLFNKYDIFKKKIQKKDLKCAFIEYTDGLNYERASEFIVGKYMENSSGRDIKKVLFTNATDTESIQQAWQEIRSVIIGK